MAPGAHVAGGDNHQFLHDRTQTWALGLVPARRMWADQAMLADPAQDVVCEHADRHHQGVRGEFAGGQALDIEVGLELAMELLRGAVIGIQVDDRRIGISTPSFEILSRRVGAINPRSRPDPDTDMMAPIK